MKNNRLLHILNCEVTAVMVALFLLVANNGFAEKGWQKVTNVSSLSVGDSVIIVAADYDFALSTTQQSNNRTATAITKSGDIAAITSDVQIMTLEAGVSAGTFAFQTGSGYLYAAGAAGATSGNNFLRTKTTLDSRCSFQISMDANGQTTVIAQTTETDRTHMRFNNSNNPKIFSCYTSGSSVSNLVAIYKYVELGAITVATPTFSVPAGLYTTPQTVAISCATAGATILYTTDNSNPSVSGQVYSTPLTISSTTTVKAIAVAGSDTSLQATATYTFPVPVADIAAFKTAGAADNSQLYQITGNVVVTAQRGNNNLYLQDATGGLLLYESGNTLDFQTGDVFQGTLVGTYTTYQNLPEFIPQGTLTAVPGGTVTALDITANQLKANFEQYAYNLVTLDNVTFLEGETYVPGTQGNSIRLVQNGDTITLYNNFRTLDTTLSAGATCSVTGIAMRYVNNNTGAVTYELAPRSNADLFTNVIQPSLTILSPADGAEYSTLDTLRINLNIQNFTLGTDGLLKIESDLLTTAGMTSPTYLNDMAWAVFQNMAFSPLPAGTFSATVSLVGLDSLPLATPASATTTFTVTAPALPTPTITVTGDAAEADNSYYFTANVTIAAEAGASIHYTIDGATPDENSTAYSAPFDVTTSCTVKAIAVKANYANSDIATTVIVIDTPTVAAPTFAPAGGVYTDSVAVSIICGDTAATVRYTTDGSEPTETSTLYEGPITLNTTTTIKAKAFKTNWHTSETVEATYTIVNEPILTVTPAALTFNSNILSNSITVSAAYINGPIVLACNNPHFTLSDDTLTNGNSTVTVTFDGTEPAMGAITITGDTLSAQVSLSATVTLPTPTFTPASGASDTLIEVAVTCANANAAIYYTTDGTTPDTTAALYTAPIELDVPGDYTVSAIAVLAGWDDSEVAAATYTVTAPAPPTPPTPDYNDTLAYYTGFEPSEGFNPTTVYNSTSERLDGPSTRQWAFVYGTVAYNSAINDSCSAQMRWFTSTPANIGYARADFDISHATRIQFNAKANRDANVLVSYSTDGGNNYIDSIFTLSSNAQTYNWVISENAEFDNVRFKFTISLPSETPTGRVDLVLDSVCIYNFPSLVSQIVEMPIISPNSSFVYEPTQVSITCATEGAGIYYTTDGSEPTPSSTLYSSPFTVSATTTVKAKAFKAGYDASNVATATYTFPVEVANIAAFKAANTTTNNTVYKITGDVTFVFENGANFYIQDATDGLLIYDNQNNNVITRTYTEGDVISGGVCGTYTLYNGLVELVPTRDLAAATSNTGTVSPVIATIADISTNYNQLESKLVKLSGVTFTEGGAFTTASATNMTIGQNNETMQVRNVFKTLDMTIPANQEADVTGFVQRYNNNFQIAPRSNEDIVLITVEMDTVATPVITVNPLTNGMVSVEIACSTEGATIYYTLDGTEPTESSTVYPESFVMADMAFTVKAIAVKEGMATSEVATYNHIPDGVCEHGVNVTLYPNPTAGQCHISLENDVIRTVSIFDMSGRLVRQEEVGGQHVDVEMGGLPGGAYLLRIVSDKGATARRVVRQ